MLAASTSPDTVSSMRTPAARTEPHASTRSSAPPQISFVMAKTRGSARSRSCCSCNLRRRARQASSTNRMAAQAIGGRRRRDKRWMMIGTVTQAAPTIAIQGATKMSAVTITLLDAVSTRWSVVPAGVQVLGPLKNEYS